MDAMMNKAVTAHMVVIFSPSPGGTTAYELMILHKELAEKLYRQAYSDGWKQRDADKIIEKMVE